MLKLEKLDKLVPPSTAGADQASQQTLPTYTKRSILTGYATIFECTIWSCAQLAGMQKKRRLTAAAAAWHAAIQDVDESANPADWVHSSLFEMVRTTAALKGGPK